jgi:hypothetical protein
LAAGAIRRGGAALVVVIVVIVSLAIGGKVLWNAARSAVTSQGCDFGSYNVELTRSENAATMVAVVTRRKLPERAAVLVLGAALQESKLDNIPSGGGDRDSVGILQQRPSQGWGTAEQLSDISYATGKFLDAMVKVPNWQNDSLAQVVQAVQVSADGSAYARHEPQAQAMSDALTGKVAAGVSCDFDKPSAVARPSAIAARLAAELPVNSPTVRSGSLTVAGASWTTAAWLVTHANEYGIDRVRCDGKTWQRSKGWKDDSASPSGSVEAVLSS